MEAGETAEPIGDLCALGVVELGRLYRLRKTSPVEVVNTLLDRIKRLTPALNAYVAVLEEPALAAARAAEELFAAGIDLGPLHGIPFSVKDVIMVRGSRTTAASRVLLDAPLDTEDASAVSRLRAAGAILLGKVNLHAALHPHEDRPSGGTYFADPGYLGRVVREAAQPLRAAGLPLIAFRTGYCSFSNAVVPILEREGFSVDLSAAPGVHDPLHDVDWRGGPQTAQWLDRLNYRAAPAENPSAIISVPIGWDGDGTDYSGHYLHNERNTEEQLTKVYRAIEARAHTRNATQVVLFLCHTYGLCDSGWGAQAVSFLNRIRGALVGVQTIQSGIDSPGAL